MWLEVFPYVRPVVELKSVCSEIRLPGRFDTHLRTVYLYYSTNHPE